MKLFEEQQALADRKFQLQQQEKRLKIKSDLNQIAAKEQVYAEADASVLERGSTFELDLKSKELSPQNCKIKEREGTGAAKVERKGLSHVVYGWSSSSLR